MRYPEPETGAGITALNKIRDRLAIDVAAFLAKGGKIEHIKSGVQADNETDYKAVSDQHFRKRQDIRGD